MAAAASTQAQSLWRDDVSKPMFADKRGSGVGDILTIVIQENSTANKSNETKTERASSLTAAITSFLYPAGATSLLTKGGQLPAMAYNSDQKHDGSAERSIIPNPLSPRLPCGWWMCCRMEIW